MLHCCIHILVFLTLLPLSLTVVQSNQCPALQSSHPKQLMAVFFFFFPVMSKHVHFCRMNFT